MNIGYKKNELEEKMLMNLHRRTWSRGLELVEFGKVTSGNESGLEDLVKYADGYKKRIDDEETKTAEELLVSTVGKIEPKKRLEAGVRDMLVYNIVQCLGTMLATVVF